MVALGVGPATYVGMVPLRLGTVAQGSPLQVHAASPAVDNPSTRAETVRNGNGHGRPKHFHYQTL